MHEGPNPLIKQPDQNEEKKRLEALRLEIKNLEQFIINMCRKNLGRVGTPEVVAEVANYAFFKALSRAETYNGGASLKSWVGTIAKHAAFDYLRKVRRFANKPNGTTNSVDTKDIIIADPSPSTEETMIREEELKNRREVLEQAVEHLSNDIQREVLKLYIRGLKNTEIAKKLNIREVTAKSALNRAKKRLGKHFGVDLRNL